MFVASLITRMGEKRVPFVRFVNGKCRERSSLERSGVQCSCILTIAHARVHSGKLPCSTLRLASIFSHNDSKSIIVKFLRGLGPIALWKVFSNPSTLRLHLMALLRLHTRDVNFTIPKYVRLTRFPFHWSIFSAFGCEKNVLEILPRLILNNCESLRLSKFSFPTSLGLITHSILIWFFLEFVFFSPLFSLLLHSQLNSIFPRSLVFTSVLQFDETPTAA